MKKTSLITGSAVLLSLVMALPTYAQGMNGNGTGRGMGSGEGRGPQGQGQMNERRGQQGPGVVGTIASISGSTLTVTSRAMGKDSTVTTDYTVNASAATIKKLAMPATGNAKDAKPIETVLALSDLAVGNTVMVTGTVSGTSVTATAIMVGEFPGRQNGEGNGIGRDAKTGEGVSGSVTAISGSSLTVKTDLRGNQAEATYTIDASAATIKKLLPETTIAVTDIAIGDSLMVKGTVSGTTMTATEITVRPHATEGQGAKMQNDNGKKNGQRFANVAVQTGNDVKVEKKGVFSRMGQSIKNFFGRFGGNK